MGRGIRASNMVIAAIIVATCLVWGASAGNITIYWGQNGNEATLANTCASGNFGFVMLSFLTNLSGTPALNLAGHCNNPELGGCQHLSNEIKSCQDSNVKLFLSLYGEYSNASDDDHHRLAAYLWNNYLGGTSDSRPLGDAVLDGIDIGVDATTGNWDGLAKAITCLSSIEGKKVYLSAGPQCPYPDVHLGTALNTGLFDYVWIQFYDNSPCEYDTDADNLVQAWNVWTSSVSTTQNQSFFLGLPASADAESSGFIQVENLTSLVLPRINSTSKYGGVMLWDKYHDEKSNYSSQIRPFV